MTTQQATEANPAFGFSRFDKAVLAVLAGALLLTLVLVWRGDRVGVKVVEFTPSTNATGVSTRAWPRVAFGSQMDRATLPETTIDPEAPGKWSWEGDSIVFRPESDLQSDTEYTVTVSGAMRSIQGQSVLEPITWSFRTGHPRALYLRWDERNAAQLYSHVPGQESLKLTSEEYGVLDFTVAPDGQTIVFSTRREDGGADLWTIDAMGGGRRVLVDCANASCTQPAWSHDGRRLAFERRSVVSEDSGALGLPRLWWYDAELNTAAPIFDDNQRLGLYPRFSPDGKWLSYLSPLEQEAHAYRLDDGTLLRVPTQTGAPTAWSPTGDSFLVSNIKDLGGLYATHIYRIDPATGQSQDLSGEDARVTDDLPSWSPDGAWVAFSRKPMDSAAGRQLWLMRSDGSEARQLTDEPDYHFAQPVWSPDMRSLVFHGFTLKGQSTEPVAWAYDLEANDLQMLAQPAFLPTWLP